MLEQRGICTCQATIPLGFCNVAQLHLQDHTAFSVDSLMILFVECSAKRGINHLFFSPPATVHIFTVIRLTTGQVHPPENKTRVLAMCTFTNTKEGQLHRIFLVGRC